MNEIRLNKFLAERLGLSRREADHAIESGQVTIDDIPAHIGQRIHLDRNEKVCYNRRLVPFSAVFIYLGMNKPVGYVCSRKAQGDALTIYDLLPEKYRNLKTVGRLDKNSSGLILLTNDGDFSFRMTHPKFIKTKLYEVELDRALEPLHQQEIADFGIEIGDGISKLGLERLDDSRKKWRVTMSEGRNRQIRRTFAALGYNVVKLHRIAFGPYQLGDLATGKYQEVPKI